MHDNGNTGTGGDLVSVATSTINITAVTGTVAQINNLLSSNATSTVNYVDNTDTPSASARR